jgi:hypothetical protein
MTPEALVLHFIDDLDSKLNQLRASREAQAGISFSRGLGRYVYLPPLPERTVDPHADEAEEADFPPDLPADADAPEPATLQPPLFQAD